MSPSSPAPEFSLAPFRFDVTPPLGHSLLGGWIPPAVAIDDPLEAIGYVLLGSGSPLVVCVLDWGALMNEAHMVWRTTLAAAAGTTPDRVAVHCLHQHNTPFVCPAARAAAAAHPDLPPIYDEQFFVTCLDRATAAVQSALLAPQRITHVAYGSAAVSAVASNRRVARDEAGRVTAMRASACTDPALLSLPEGLIDPTLQTVAFYGAAGRRLVACHYYATHPMSFYRDGRVTADFCGLARRRRQTEDPGCKHLYFTGCAANISAGKYNDGSPAARIALTDRIHAGLLASEATLVPRPLTHIAWRTVEVLPPPTPSPTAADLLAAIADPGLPLVDRLLPAYRLGWLRRYARGIPFVLSRLFLNEISVVHLPGEMFVEFQLRARALRPGQPVAVAAYGDDGLWYVPTKEEYSAGGYEVSVAFASAEADELFTSALTRLLND